MINSIKLKEIANIRLGITNRINQGDEEYEIVDSKTIQTQKTQKVTGFITKERFEEIKIKQNSIIIPNYESTNYLLGSEYLNKLPGRNIYIIEVDVTKYDLNVLVMLIKYQMLNIPIEGTVIERIKKCDLEEVELPILNDDLKIQLKRLNEMEELLNKQQQNMQKYIKGLLQLCMNKKI